MKTNVQIKYICIYLSGKIGNNFRRNTIILRRTGKGFYLKPEGSNKSQVEIDEGRERVPEMRDSQ